MADDQTNALSIGSNLDATSNDLDTTVGHLHDLSNGLAALLLRNTDGLGKLNLLSVHLDGHSLSLLLLLSSSSGDKLDLVSTSEKDGNSLAGWLLDVLDKNSHWVFARAVLGQNGLASMDSLRVERVSDIVEGADIVLLEGASGVSLSAEKTELDVLEHGLGSSGWEDNAGQLVGLHVLELEDGVGLVDVDRDKLLIRGHASLDLELALLDGGGLWVGIFLHVDVADSLEHVFNLVGHVLETLRDVGVLNKETKRHF